MGDYEDVLASLESLNHSVLKAMGYTKKVSGCRWPRGSRAPVLLQFHPCLRMPGFLKTGAREAYLRGGLGLGLFLAAEINWEENGMAW